tara:strand:- start:41 stop:250 length:210 start_codon:yes stop_codon:yes gene_type:complete
MGCTMVVMTPKEMELAKEMLKTQSPLIGGYHGAVMRKYLKLQKERIELIGKKDKRLYGFPIRDTSFRGF